VVANSKNLLSSDFVGLLCPTPAPSAGVRPLPHMPEHCMTTSRELAVPQLTFSNETLIKINLNVNEIN